MRKYLSFISLLFIITFLTVFFITPQVLDYYRGWEGLILLLLILGAFFTALFSVKGPLKMITLIISSIGMLVVAFILFYVIGMVLFGNFGT
jgi:hypothetical protein